MRRANGTGSIRTLSGRRRKKYQALVSTWVEENGERKQKQVSLGCFEKKCEARDTLDRFRLNPYDITARNTTVKDIYDTILPKQTESMQKGFIAMWKFFAPIENRKIADIRKSDLQLVAMATEGKSASLQSKVKSIARQIFREAMENDICQKDYSAFMEFPESVKRKAREALTKKEIDIVLSEGTPTLRTLLYTGMRISEALRAPEYIVETENGLFIDVKESKTKSGLRLIPVHKEIEKDIFKIENVPYPTFVDRYSKWSKEYGVTHTLHEYRHTFSTYAKQCGMDEFYRRYILGHKQKDLSDAVYTHAIEETLVSEMSKLNYD